VAVHDFDVTTEHINRFARFKFVVRLRSEFVFDGRLRII
jgi:hypothetical protein